MRAIPAVRLPRVAAVARRSAVVPASARRFSAPAAEPAPAAAPPEAPAAPPKAKPRRRFGVFRGTLALVALTAGAYYATEWYEAGGHTAPDPLAALASDAIRDARRRLEELRDAALAATGQDVRASQAADASTAAEPVAREAPVAPATSTSPQKEAVGLLSVFFEEFYANNRSVQPKPAPAVSPSAPTKEEPKKEAVKETVTEAKPAKTADVSKVPSKDVVPKEAPKESAKSASTPAPAPAVAASAPSSPPNLAPAAPATQPAATAAAASPSPSFLQKQLDLFSDLPALAALTLQVEALKDALKTADMPRQEIVAALEKLSSKVDELERNEMEFVKEALDDQVG